jgi:glucosyl-dolichyl phosphate glucuronosyltransferase
MHVTVAICTWNRADLLDVTLTSLSRVRIPAGVTWHVMVSNNNSTDHTEQVLDKHIKRLPLVPLFAPRPGKSHAMNEVVARLQGDLVLWTDDDVEFPENWVASYVDAACRWPEANFFGGRIVPRFLAQEPPWLRPAWEFLSSVYAERELGDEPFAFDHKRLPFGANMAARVAMQKRYRYDPLLGRRGGLMLAGEETEMMKQWLSDGCLGMWVPQSCVEHIITPDRLELEHLRRFFFGLGESKTSRAQESSRLIGLVQGAWYAARALKYQSYSRLFPPSKSSYRGIKYLIRSSYCWGRVESQWRHLPSWLKPNALRQLMEIREQPRFVMTKQARAAIGM